MKKFRLAFLLPFFTLNAFAQKGYVITNNDDTIKCIVQKELINNVVRYKLNKNDAYKKVDPDSIREYQLTRNGSIYLLQYLHDKKTYVKWLEKGKINLFEEHYVAYTTVSSYGKQDVVLPCWYVSKNNFILQRLPADDLECRTLIMSLFNDNFDLLVAFRAANDVSLENIEDYIKRYNQAAAANHK